MTSRRWWTGTRCCRTSERLLPRAVWCAFRSPVQARFARPIPVFARSRGAKGTTRWVSRHPVSIPRPAHERLTTSETACRSVDIPCREPRRVWTASTMADVEAHQYGSAIDGHRTSAGAAAPRAARPATTGQLIAGKPPVCSRSGTGPPPHRGSAARARAHRVAQRRGDHAVAAITWRVRPSRRCASSRSSSGRPAAGSRSRSGRAGSTRAPRYRSAWRLLACSRARRSRW